MKTPDEIRTQIEDVETDLGMDNPKVDKAYFRGWIDALEWALNEEK